VGDGVAGTQLFPQHASGDRQGPPLVIPVFIPHEGCPHSCLFCNQKKISGVTGRPVSAGEVSRIVCSWLARPRTRKRNRIQVAFYGGSFTCLERKRQQELLAAVAPFIADGSVQDVRLSTRPDYISAEIIAFLQAHRVTIVELGVQSLNNEVLQKSLRGHTAEDTVRSARLLKQAGMELGLQLMVGLPGQTFACLRKTMDQVISLAPDFVRIYPVLVVAGSGLARLYQAGDYRPLTLARATAQVAWMKRRCTAAGIRVVRMGLQPGEELENSLLAGPYHPAFGELVNARLMLQRTRKLLTALDRTQHALLSISPQDVSTFYGPGSINRERLTGLGLFDKFSLHMDPSQCRGTVKLLTTKDA